MSPVGNSIVSITTGIYASDGRYVGYQYDSFNRLLEMKEYVGGKVLETGYHYDDQSNHSYKTGLFRGIFLNGQRQIAYSYDDMSRRDKRVVMTAVPFVTEYTYYDGATSGTTSTVVKTLKNGSTTWEYAYDAVGNITSIKENGTVVESYGYDALNQLTTVVRGGDTYSYSYDASGNITAVTKNGGSYKSYSYGNSNWKDLLTAYNGTTITYDAIGNPLTYRDGFTFTWSNGRQLATAAKGGNTYSYTYDASGLRTSKTVGGVTTQYYWLGDKLQAQKTGNDYLIFLYDESGVPYGLIHKYGSTEITYYYEYNLQGDIIGIINDEGTRVVTYEYSAWGELLSTSGSMASNIGATNPLRYRGYYYDSETGFYYLQSRYYDPVTCRFINEDSLISTGQGVLGYNMFAYCGNNPIKNIDSLGYYGICVLDDPMNVNRSFMTPGMFGGGGGGGVAGVSSSYYARQNASEYDRWWRNSSYNPNMTWSNGTASQQSTSADASVKGSTGRTEPNNLLEQLAMEQVKSNPSEGTILKKIQLRDPRWPSSEGWVKMQQLVPTSYGNINIHYVYNQHSGISDDFKFKS